MMSNTCTFKHFFQQILLIFVGTSVRGCLYVCLFCCLLQNYIAGEKLALYVVSQIFQQHVSDLMEHIMLVFFLVLSENIASYLKVLRAFCNLYKMPRVTCPRLSTGMNYKRQWLLCSVR